MMNWVSRIRRGDFDCIPEFDWHRSAEIAHVFDGYEVAGGAAECAAIGEKVKADWRSRFEGSTGLELWVALFWSHRGYRHSGTEPSDSELPFLDALCTTLRKKLLSFSEPERVSLMNRIKAHMLSSSTDEGQG